MPSPQAHTHDPVALGREVTAACRALGFALAGVVEAAPTRRQRELREWLAAGKHGSMRWMEDLLDERLDPRRMLPGAKSMVMVADVYPGGEPEPASPGTARIARYARGRDYHAIIKRRLHTLADRLRARHPGHEFRSFVDTGPVLEREHAARAGLGWIGKHTLLIHPRLGSYLLLGGMVTTLEMRPPPEEARGIDDACGTCTRCIDACPTGAITPYSVDARRCISYLTIEHSGEIDEDLREGVGDRIFGCDVCQEVCPFNRDLDDGRAYPAYRSRPEGGRRSLPILQVLSWGREEYDARVAGSAMKRASLGMLKRNAAIAAASAPASAEVIAALERTSADEGAPPEARGAARWALARLSGMQETRQNTMPEKGGSAKRNDDEQKTS